MILVGNQRGGAYDLARHLLKDENERVEVHSLRGFAAQDLRGALQESYAVSRATQCKQHLYSLSLNPPKSETPRIKDFEAAIADVEAKLGLSQQPLAIVFHEKFGKDGKLRRHAHSVWCRIDTEEGKAVHLPFSNQKLNTISRALFQQHGWTLPRGYQRHEPADPRTYSLAEWQQSKRAGRDPAKMKEIFQDAWAMSDSTAGFARALKDHGLILARGDRRGFVAMDHKGEAYAVTRYAGLKTKAVRDRLGDGATLPTASEAHQQAARRVGARVKELIKDQKQRAKQDLALLKDREATRQKQYRDAESRLCIAQRQRESAEETIWQGRSRKGWRGLIDVLTGRKRKIDAQNRIERDQAVLRDRDERQQLADHHAAQKARLAQQVTDTKTKAVETLNTLRRDLRQLHRKKPAILPRKRRAKPPPDQIPKPKKESARISSPEHGADPPRSSARPERCTDPAVAPQQENLHRAPTPRRGSMTRIRSSEMPDGPETCSGSIAARDPAASRAAQPLARDKVAQPTTPKSPKLSTQRDFERTATPRPVSDPKPPQNDQNKDDKRAAFKAKRRPTSDRPRRRSRSGDGPSLER